MYTKRDSLKKTDALDKAEKTKLTYQVMMELKEWEATIDVVQPSKKKKKNNNSLAETESSEQEESEDEELVHKPAAKSTKQR